MKEGIHPKYYPEARVICACGNTWATGSTQEEIHTEMCSACHPFFTGEQRIVDTAGQVDRFERRKDRAVKMAEQTARRQLKKEKKAESLFEFVSEVEREKPTLEEALQAAAAAQPAAEQVSAPAEQKPEAKRGKPRESKPREAKPEPARSTTPRKPRKAKTDGEPTPPAKPAPEPAAQES